jgi:hypothetical protein
MNSRRLWRRLLRNFSILLVEEDSKAEQKAVKTFDQKHASLLILEAVERLIAVWNMGNNVMQYPQVIGSRTFVEYGYGLPRDSSWIEFVGLATIAAKWCKLIEFGE